LEAHNQSALRLKTRLFFQPAVIVASVPYQLQSSHSDDTAASTTPPTWQTWLPAIPLRADATHRAEPAGHRPRVAFPKFPGGRRGLRVKDASMFAPSA